MFKYINNYATETVGQVLAADTTITVTNATPIVLGTGNVCRLTIQNDDATIFEIVDVVAVSGNTLTVQRGKDGTSALNWDAASAVVCSITAGQANNYDVKNEAWFSAASGAINRENGSKQAYTLTANEAISFTLNDGDDLTLLLNPSTFTVTMPTIKWFGGAIIFTANKMHSIVISKKGADLLGWWEVEA